MVCESDLTLDVQVDAAFSLEVDSLFLLDSQQLAGWGEGLPSLLQMVDLGLI